MIEIINNIKGRDLFLYLFYWSRFIKFITLFLLYIIMRKKEDNGFE